ncbi:MAG: ribonuclease M5 [Firmicutes bacterium]|nr:ribonuclease M5 [Bacillota bacterium]
MNNPKDDILPKVAEVIVVEGRDDTQAIRRAVRAVTIETHGFGISKNTWEKIENAYKDYGIIVFTDPDHAGEEIRRKITEKFPDAKQAFLSREKASEKKTSSGYTDIGIENASPEDIREALEKSRAKIAPETNGNTVEQIFKMSDLDIAGLTGGEGSKERREKLGDILGIGYANAKGLLYKLNTLGIERAAFDEAIKRIK